MVYNSKMAAGLIYGMHQTLTKQRYYGIPHKPRKDIGRKKYIYALLEKTKLCNYCGTANHQFKELALNIKDCKGIEDPMSPPDRKKQITAAHGCNELFSKVSKTPNSFHM